MQPVKWTRYNKHDDFQQYSNQLFWSKQSKQAAVVELLSCPYNG